MWVVVVGVAGSAIIIKILDLLFPSCEHRYNLHQPGIGSLNRPYNKCTAILVIFE